MSTFQEFMQQKYGHRWAGMGYSSGSMEEAYEAGAELGAVEREYLEACYDFDVGSGDNSVFGRKGDRIDAAYKALRAHRSPPKVDRVAEALRLVDSAMFSADREKLRDLLTTELEARKEAK